MAAARQDNPEIKAAEARYRAMQQRPIQEGTLPDPTVGVRFHNEDFGRITFGESEFSYLEFLGRAGGALSGQARLARRHRHARGGT